MSVAGVEEENTAKRLRMQIVYSIMQLHSSRN